MRALITLSVVASAWASPASATTPEDAAPAFRLHTATAASRASLRAVVAPGTATVFSEALRVRYGGERWSGEVQQNLVQATAPSVDWSHGALGRTVLSGRLHFTDERRHAWLVETDFGVADAQAWGSHAVETLRGFSVRTGWEGTWMPGRSTLIARVAGGIGVLSDLPIIVPVTFDTGFAWVFPVSQDAGLSGVLEFESHLVDIIPVGGRMLLRWEPADGDWLFDVGGQLSTDYDSDEGSGAVIVQVGRTLPPIQR